MRIRSIKPEFWKNEHIASCSEFARLLAIALLNYADDHGYFWSHPRLIHGELFPFLDDSQKILGAIQELSQIGYLAIMEASDGRTIGHIVNFLKHQRVDKPKRSEIQEKLARQDSSKTHPRTVQDSSKEEWKGMEGNGKGMEGNGMEAEEAAATSDILIQSQRLFETYAAARRSHLADGLREAKACIIRHGYDTVLAGTQAIVAAISKWSQAEKINFVKRPDDFFRGDHWADDPALWLPRKDREALAHQSAAEQPHNHLGGRRPTSTTII
jgi:hypothetical protein